MIVVSDTGPLNYLALICYIDVLPKLYGQVVVPPAVAAELSRSRTPTSVKSLIQERPAWLRIEQPPVPIPGLQSLGDGEQQAIALAELLNADLLLCDDRGARELALARKLRVIGTVGVLQEASDHGLLNLADGLAKLRQTNFRISRALIEGILNKPRDV